MTYKKNHIPWFNTEQINFTVLIRYEQIKHLYPTSNITDMYYLLRLLVIFV